ncbi:uncharacterized membrane protein YcaP (DUF421 family) [Alicyclobacillus sacchari]|uniref:Uncharacterized membrane protein YcaP (DUF421 family) n=1 Tax=Alicyclobacillus sacchari TaxID=392010 RepID=A0A4R8LTW2_9BACL|nr:DUF421 domain-containing protein [Alicyclobacillus sacchari]TDY51054.1 uncharacterized membrane protein YcaP (DUF421 family) [Alicyclobacillus sacchari]GMA56277.1 hypothetical protein GCM10025858_07800 [Alicyclobacillus sacchari]
MHSVPLWQFPARALVLYLIVMVALRIMGKREIGQLSVFDLVVSVMMAELSTLPMEDRRVPIYEAAISIASLVLFQVAVAFLQIKSHRFRHLIDGEPSVLIEHGRIQDREMQRIRYSVHDLLTQLREKGVANVADVEFAILETSGQLSVIPKAEARPLTARDLGKPVAAEAIPLPLVIDGRPVPKTLAIIGRDEVWLRDELEHRGYALENVFYATIDAAGAIWIDERDRT